MEQSNKKSWKLYSNESSENIIKIQKSDYSFIDWDISFEMIVAQEFG